jgi:LmbE family N-acetylglucosaminyl deacetylase
MHSTSERDGETKALQSASIAAAEVLGASTPMFAGLPDNRMDELALLEVVKIIENVVSDCQPQIVYTHFAHDLNIDHRVTYQAVMTACRPLPGAQWHSIFAFETVSSTEWSEHSGKPFHPNHFVDIVGMIEKKQAALEAYAVEMRQFPHPRSIESLLALSKVRGASVGLQAAEAFEVVRSIR